MKKSVKAFVFIITTVLASLPVVGNSTDSYSPPAVSDLSTEQIAIVSRLSTVLPEKRKFYTHFYYNLDWAITGQSGPGILSSSLWHAFQKGKLIDDNKNFEKGEQNFKEAVQTAFSETERTPAGKGIYASESIISSASHTNTLVEVEVAQGLRYLDLTDFKVTNALKRAGISVQDVYKLGDVSLKMTNHFSAKRQWVLKDMEKVSLSPFRLSAKSLVEIQNLLRPIFSGNFKSSQDDAVRIIKLLIHNSKSEVEQLIRVFNTTPALWNHLNADSQDRVIDSLVRNHVESVAGGIVLFQSFRSAATNHESVSMLLEGFTTHKLTPKTNGDQLPQTFENTGVIFSEKHVLRILSEAKRHIYSVAEGIFLISYMDSASLSGPMQTLLERVFHKTLSRVKSLEDGILLLDFLKEKRPHLYIVKRGDIIDKISPYVDNMSVMRQLSNHISDASVADILRRQKCSFGFE